MKRKMSAFAEGCSKRMIIVVAHVAGLVSAGLFAAGILRFRRQRRTKPTKGVNPLAPSIERTESVRGQGGKIEKFSHYIARQMGFGDESECSELIKLGYDYLKKTQGIDERMFEYLSNEPNCEDLYVKLVEELERCILGYFAFNWDDAPQLITQVLSVESEQKKLKDLVMAATRKQRFEKITKYLKVTRMLSTLVEEMKVMGTSSRGDDLNSLNVMVPAAITERSPVLLFMGGGMGAGKSTVLKDIMKECFWSGVAANAVVVEADAFKETDVIYRALSSRGHHQDMLQTAELVHQSSTDAASSLLVTALNEGRDVIMDGTLSWVPFVEQTIAMARNVHKHQYRMGEGYKVAEDGTVTESYWVQVDDDQDDADAKRRKPYRIELVGVICDAYLAVVRGIRRAIQMKRAVRVKAQLKSHKRFATAFPRYSQLVDNARLYSTNGIGAPPKLIAWKDGDSKLLVDPEEIKWLKLVSSLNDEADSIYDLYEDDVINQADSVWRDIVSDPQREIAQTELRAVVKKLQAPAA